MVQVGAWLMHLFMVQVEVQVDAWLMHVVGPQPSFEEYLVIVDRLVLRMLVEDGVHREAEIMAQQ